MKKSFHDEDVEEIFKNANLSRDYVPTSFVESEVIGVLDNLEQIDKLIADNCKKWSINRIPVICLSIMRIAVYEMVYVTDIDTGVAINEAVELSKKYASEDDKSYINGILGSIARAL